MKLTKKQPLFIVTGASCVGKSTLCNELFIIVTDDMTKEDIIIALLAKQTLCINTIKNIIVGFTVLAIACGVCAFLVSIS